MTEATAATPSQTVVAIAQFAPGTDKKANLESLRSLASDAAARGAKVVVAPEYSMFTAPKTDERLIESAEDLDGEFGSALASVAAEFGIFLVAGMNERIDDVSRISNTLVAMDPNGELVATYRKLHLYDAFGYQESAVIRAGEITEPQTFGCDGLTFGLPDLLRPALPGSHPAHRRRRRRHLAPARPVGAGAAQGRPLDHSRARPGHREHDVHRSGRSERARRRGCQHDRRPDGRRDVFTWRAGRGRHRTRFGCSHRRGTREESRSRAAEVHSLVAVTCSE